MPTPRAAPHRLRSGSSHPVSLSSGPNPAAVGPEHCCQSSSSSTAAWRPWARQGRLPLALCLLCSFGGALWHRTHLGSGEHAHAALFVALRMHGLHPERACCGGHQHPSVQCHPKESIPWGSIGLNAGLARPPVLLDSQG